jgi:hypothetical protein
MYFKNNFYSDQWDKFVVITVATEDNDDLRRFKNSCDSNNVPYIILGLGDEWKSGHAENGVLLDKGGAQKIIYLREELKKWPVLDDHIVLFTDSYDVVFFEGCKEILKKFRESNSQILFSCEKTCWPEESLVDSYPKLDVDYPYLNSGGFIGYANQILKIIDFDLDISYDDQLYYTEKFLEYQDIDQEFIKLDYNREIFQTLNLGIDDVNFVNNKCYKKDTDQTICVLHANGPSWVKKYLREKTFEIFQYSDKTDNKFDRVQKKTLDVDKIIQWSIFIQHNVSDINQIFDHVLIMDYPKENITLNLVYNKEEHQYKIEKFLKKHRNSFKNVIVEYNNNFLDARKKSIVMAKNNCDFLILMDSNHIFRNNKSIQLLISKNLNFVSPMIFEENSDWVNFSVATYNTKEKIFNYEIKNNFVVDYVYGIYVIKENQLDIVTQMLGQNSQDDDANWDNFFCSQAKAYNFPLYICNMNFYGSIIK